MFQEFLQIRGLFAKRWKCWGKIVILETWCSAPHFCVKGQQKWAQKGTRMSPFLASIRRPNRRPWTSKQGADSWSQIPLFSHFCALGRKTRRKIGRRFSSSGTHFCLFMEISWATQLGFFRLCLRFCVDCERGWWWLEILVGPLQLIGEDFCLLERY